MLGVHTTNSDTGQVGIDYKVDPVLASYACTAYCDQDTETGKYRWSGIGTGTDEQTFMTSKSYWTCTEYDYVSQAPFRVFFNYHGSPNIIFGAFQESLGENAYTETKARLRAFVHF